MRAALYILAAVALYYAGGFYDVGALLVAAVAMALLGAASFALSRASLAGLRVDVRPAADDAVVGGETTFLLTVENASPLPLAACRVVLETSSEPPRSPGGRATDARRHAPRATVFGTAAALHAMQVPVCAEAAHCGTVALHVSSVSAYDPLGLFPAKCPAACSARVPVLPRGGAPVDVDARPVAGSASVDLGALDASAAGPEPPDVLDVRPWQPGDPLGSIHWKLSARTGDMQSKRYEAASSADAAVLFDPFAADGSGASGDVRDDLDAAAFDAWCEAARNLAEGLVRAGVPFVALWPCASEDGGRVGEAVVDSPGAAVAFLRAMVASVPRSDRLGRDGALARAAELCGGREPFCLAGGPGLYVGDTLIAAFDDRGAVSAAGPIVLAPQPVRGR